MWGAPSGALFLSFAFHKTLNLLIMLRMLVAKKL